MPVTEPSRPEDDVSEIERETAHLAQTIEHAREAVHRARLADSMALQGEDYSDFSDESDEPDAPASDDADVER